MEKRSIGQMIIEQLSDFLIMILLAAAVASAAIEVPLLRPQMLLRARLASLSVFSKPLTCTSKISYSSLDCRTSRLRVYFCSLSLSTSLLASSKSIKPSARSQPCLHSPFLSQLSSALERRPRYTLVPSSLVT
jgi:hypothetical protein